MHIIYLTSEATKGKGLLQPEIRKRKLLLGRARIKKKCLNEMFVRRLSDMICLPETEEVLRPHELKLQVGLIPNNQIHTAVCSRWMHFLFIHQTAGW